MKVNDYASVMNETNSLGYLSDKNNFLTQLAEYVDKIKELRTKNRELYHRNEIQKRIISILAHDVRSPLASIKSIIELKQSKLLNAEESVEIMDMVTDQLTSTIEMVENVVSWGQVDLQFGHLKLKDFDVHQLLERIFGSELLTTFAKNNKLINLVEPGAVIHSDQDAVEFILRNLISNANKYTENGTITVNMRRTDTKTILSVSDTGVGMSGEQACQLLNSDNTHNSTPGTHNEKGSGMGLLLIQEFIDRLGGSVNVESTKNEGTTFTIEI